MNKRYFIIIFTGINKLKTSSTGQGTIITKHGEYINATETENNLKEQFDYDDVCIVNIIELNEKDFENFTKE